ncbi:ArgE/DapE family deacylase [Enterococcus sp. BWR-S5]|uniref:ArgE/DapE family deacylase n=1 Tax=Enterococcus sp. BWR-S5 TaxID=2787714 RepID=UPI0019230270|nr:ArgE/DapE family deacylase [Enterococcus sp. BWR-S5]MBL1227099.1 ArgE/DapE family deacylase [Enterococcus sp. BWR-S5]
MKKLDAVKVLQDVVKINSVNGNEEEVAFYLEKLFTEYGIKSKLIKYDEGRMNLIAEIGNGSGPVLGFDGHQDTVSIGDESKWTYPPLGAVIADRRMYGRGTTDMKSGLVAIVIAMIQLEESDIEINGTVRLYATVGEEKGELGAGQIADLGLVDDLEALVVCEPTGADYKTLKLNQEILNQNITPYNGEKRLIFIGHKGSINYEVQSEGIAAHSSMPQLGINAITPLIQFYEKQQAYFDSLKLEDELLGLTTPVVTLINGGEQINTVPANASLGVKIRTIPQIGNQEIINKIQHIVDECNKEKNTKLTLKVSENVLPVKSKKSAKIVKVCQEVVEKELNQKVPIVGISGGTDASQFIRVKPDLNVVVCGPGNSTAHQIDEYVEVNNFLEFITIYENLIKKYFDL